MNELTGLIIAEVFLLAAAAIGLAFNLLNRKMVAAIAMSCVVAGFTGVLFTRHYHAARFISGEEPVETYYHVARMVDGRLVSDCIHAPTGVVRPFATEGEARTTGRVPCRCVRQGGVPSSLVSLPASAGRPRSGP